MNNYHKKRRRNAMVQANKPKCRRKVSYEHSIDAWQAAEYHYITKLTLSMPYKCCVGDHYHLTSQASLGDMSQVPEYYRELFQTHSQEEIPTSFISKLRKRLV